MREKEIQIKVNKVKFKVWYAEDKKQFHYGLDRNNKALLASSNPIKRRLEVSMNIYKDLQEAIGYEIRNEIEKLLN